ncbi:hypothetical protein [Methylobacterium planeticum]|uniref:Uncharacterized protein n=1 Tax=Methylobacterium planeticum TaxID=2615211 RepID=A0A6N6MIA1_9HYPH|nr:hypothetical protein [Methylobacterium planeticum]KAB1069266.1 hypothetical protein F6X51_25670 [Methylobacterium planeticum]
MSAPLVTLALREATNADWTSSFVLPAIGTTPWTTVPPWSSATQYGASSAVVYGGDLYVAAVAAPTLGSFLPAQWTKIGIAANFADLSYDLAGAEIRMRLADVDGAGAPLPEKVRVKFSSTAGTLNVNVASRRISLVVPAAKIRGIPAATYAIDALAEKAGAITRIAAGSLVVDQGVTR